MLGSLLGRVSIVVFAAVAATPAYAGDGEDYGRPGVYAGVQVATGTATHLRKEFEDVTGIDNGRVDTIVGAGARAGYRITSRFAAEAQFEWLPGFNFEVNDPQSQSTDPQVRITESRDIKLWDGDTWLVTANGKFYFRDDERFQPYLLGGVGYMRQKADVYQGPQDVSADEFAARMGVGFDAYVTNCILFAMDVQWVKPTGDLKDFDYMSISAGLQYRF